ncbi:uncharacterized protein Bfra_002542 [Botrytis fragariae]|uniref:Uncharacterized protein n=1 Tax=Botrytis fragariae TaxID=1964551 RepID=A0A8H6AYW4_9HELO|nr:uncharacterized protein Bfra_002542 [Botrytis fragariae]KAF5876141.1 hypothetical protein Bfra_002542 [Botrytis fragariae]
MHTYFPGKQSFLNKAVHLVGQEFQQRRSSVVCFKPSGLLGRDICLFSSVVKRSVYMTNCKAFTYNTLDVTFHCINNLRCMQTGSHDAELL